MADNRLSRRTRRRHLSNAAVTRSRPPFATISRIGVESDNSGQGRGEFYVSFKEIGGMVAFSRINGAIDLLFRQINPLANVGG